MKSCFGKQDSKRSILSIHRLIFQDQVDPSTCGSCVFSLVYLFVACSNAPILPLRFSDLVNPARAEHALASPKSTNLVESG